MNWMLASKIARNRASLSLSADSARARSTAAQVRSATSRISASSASVQFLVSRW